MVTKRWALSACGTVAVLALTACTGSVGAAPDPAPLLSASAASMRPVRTVHLTMTVNGALPGVPVSGVDSDLTADGQAQGTAKISSFGQLVDYQFVLYGDALYLKGPTGPFDKYPARMVTSVLDPAAILNPDKGLAHLLAAITSPESAGVDDDDDKITGHLTADAIKPVLPQVTGDVTVSVWLNQDSKHLPDKIEVTVPNSNGDNGTVVDLVLSNVDAPVTVRPPA